MPLTQKHRTLGIGTPLGEDVLVLRTLSTVEALGRPFEYQLELGSEKADIAFKDILGQNVTIRLELPGGGTRYFNGFVSRFGHAGQRGRVFHYHATVVPWLWLLSRASDCRIFQEMTAPEIIRKVFRDRGFSDFRENLSASYRKWEYCVQYRETDFNFVSRLMEQEGIYYYFEHENGKHTLVLCDSVSAHKPFAGYESVNFRPFDDGVHKKDFIYEWRVEETLQPGVYELNDFDFKKPRKGLATRAVQPGPHANSDLPIYDYPGEYTEFGDGQQYAQVRLQGLHAQYHLYHGQANARGLCVGSTFKLAEFPVAALNKEYLITQVAYTVRGDPFEADDASSGGEFCGVRFSALPSTTPFRTTPSTPRPIVQGPQTALVVGKAGEEIWTDPHGRVKVKFHWDRYAKADENSSCWIRVSQNWASKKWGTFFLPRIGQEVIVEFLEGDPDRPIVTGCVYNGDAPTPYDLPKEATKSTIKTNTSKGGNGFNEIRFEDKKGKEQIFIHGQRDLDVRIRDDIRETNYGNRDIRVGWEKDGATGGDLNTLVRKDVNTHVQGGQFEQVDKQLNQTVKEDVVEDYQKNQTTLVKDKYQLNAKEIIVEGGQVISHKSGKITIQGAQGVHIKGMSVAIEGSTGVSLKVGGNFVSVNPAGVAIKGSMVMINSGGSPLSAEAAKAVVAPEIQAPLEARRADDGKTGGPTKVSASPRSILKRLLSPFRAPAFVIPPPVVPQLPVVQTPPTSKPPSKTDYGYVFSCKHDSRECNGSKTLEIVPDAGGDVITCRAQPKKQLHGQFLLKAAGAASAYDTDAMRALGNVVGRPFTNQIKIPPWYILASGSTSMEKFLAVYRLRKTRTIGKSFDLLAQNPAGETGRLVVFPSDNLTVSITTEEFWEKLADPLEAFADKLRPFLGRTFKIGKKGFNSVVGPFFIDVKTPQLKIAGRASWKENSPTCSQPWAVALTGKISVGFDPLIGMEVKWDLGLTLATAGAGTGLGTAFLAAYKGAKKALGNEPPIYVTVGGEAGGTVSTEIDAQGPKAFEGKIGGKLTIGLGIQVGVKDVVAGKCEGSTEAGAEIGVEDAGDAPKLVFTGSAGQLKVTLEFKLKVNKWIKFLDDIGYEEEFSFFEGWTIKREIELKGAKPPAS